MACLPGSPCYNAYYHPEDLNCGCNECIITSDKVIYIGPNLPNTGIKNRDLLTSALQTIDSKLDPSTLAAAILQAIDTDSTLKATLCNIISTCI